MGEWAAETIPTRSPVLFFSPPAGELQEVIPALTHRLVCFTLLCALIQLESSAEQLESYKKASADYQERFIRERNVRRKLHEQLQVLKGNIRVICR